MESSLRRTKREQQGRFVPKPGSRNSRSGGGCWLELPQPVLNGVPLAHPAWLDTVNVPYRGFIDVILDFTDPVIKGMSVFHCHLLNHEDKGMMAKILFK